ncbi:MAG: nitrate ABC transporter permease [Anaerolineae bacterium]|nr:nitrate ABC transporter permease [Anaerolineae bacterium]
MITAKPTRLQTQLNALTLPFKSEAVIKKLKTAASNLFWASAGFALLLVIWQIVAIFSPDLSGPAETLPVLWAMLSHPFYDNGPNDKGIGIQVLFSLGRVFSGWLIGSLIAIPVGMAMGANRKVMQALNPVVQVLRPVSPLAWYPIGLAAYHSAASAVVFAIVITSLWPTLINTMFGVASLPNDYHNVARVFRFSRWQYLTKVLLPYSLPYLLTGLRLSLGIAWMVIVAAEMLAGGTGIGFFVWDSWNALSLPRVISAILIIGVIGLVLDRGLEWLIQRVSYTA